MSCSGQYLLDLLVDNDAYSMLCNIINTSCFAMVAFMRHSLLDGSCALDKKMEFLEIVLILENKKNYTKTSFIY